MKRFLQWWLLTDPFLRMAKRFQAAEERSADLERSRDNLERFAGETCDIVNPLIEQMAKLENRVQVLERAGNKKRK
jgi:hypothetical protein